MRDAAPMGDWMSVAGSLAGVAVGFSGSFYLSMWQGRAAWRNQRELAVSEVLAAAGHVQLGVHMVRAIYLPTSKMSDRLSRGAQMFAALAPGNAAEEEGGWRAFSELRYTIPAIGRLLNVKREQTQCRRRVLLDLSTLMTPQAVRFYSAVAAPPIRTETRLLKVKDALIEAVGTLLENINASEPEYARLRDRVTEAILAFRSSNEALETKITVRSRISGRWHERERDVSQPRA